MSYMQGYSYTMYDTPDSDAATFNMGQWGEVMYDTPSDYGLGVISEAKAGVGAVKKVGKFIGGLFKKKKKKKKKPAPKPAPVAALPTDGQAPPAPLPGGAIGASGAAGPAGLSPTVAIIGVGAALLGVVLLTQGRGRR